MVIQAVPSIGEPTKTKDLVECAKDSWSCIEIVRDGCRIGDIGAVIQSLQKMRLFRCEKVRRPWDW